MATDTLEAPPQLSLETAMSQQVQHDSAVMRGQEPPKFDAPQPAAKESTDLEAQLMQKAKEAPKPEAKPKQEVQKKPDATNGKEIKTDAKKSDPLSKFDAVQPSEDDMKQQSKWMQLKAAEKERDELKPKLGEYENRIKELEAKIWPDDKIKRFEELQTKERAWEVENTPEWHQHIEVPFKQREAWIDKMVAHYKLDKDQLWAALDIADPFARGEKIDEVLGSSEKPIPANTAGSLAQIGNDLQTIYGEMERKRADALKMGASLESEKAQMTEKQQAEEQQALTEAQEEVRGQLEKKLPSMFSDEDLKIAGISLADAVKGAAPADNPRGRAYQAQAGEILPYIVHKLMDVEQRLAAFHKEEKDRNEAKPGMTPTGIKLPSDDKPEFASLDDAMKAQPSWEAKNRFQ